jgi:uncharacterized protein
MARKKAQKKKLETTLMPHRTPNLSVLLERAKSGDAAQSLKGYLDAGGSADVLVHSRREPGQQLSLLNHMALHNSHPHAELAECVRLLVGAGADINATSSCDDRTALLCASERRCCTRPLQIFLQNGADVMLMSSAKGMTALHYAASAAQTGSCEVLIAKKSSLVHMKDYNGLTALFYAVMSGPLGTINMLLQHGVDIHTAGAQGTTCLMLACGCKHVNVATFLIEAGVNVNAVDCNGCSALMTAVEVNSTAMAKLLLEHGVNIAATDTEGQNVLFRAALKGHVSMMKLLVQRGLSVTALDNKGATVLMIAAIEGHKPAAEWLLQQGVPVNAVDNSGCTALHYASMKTDAATVVELLLANGADVNKSTTDSKTALELAAQFGHIQCIRALIAAGAAVTSTDDVNASSLH